MKTITKVIKISKKEIFEQIAKKSAYIGAKMKEESAFDRISIIDENEEFFNEYFEIAHAECVEMLYSFTQKELNEEDAESDSVTTAIPSYNITLTLSDNISETTFNLLQNLTSEYIVCRLMAEWMMVAHIEYHSYWIERYTSVRAQINKTLTARMKPLRRTIRPF